MSLSNLESQFAVLEKSFAGTLGVNALHFKSGATIQYHSDEKFLMCSTYKLPMAICLLQQIENEKIHLTDYIEVTENDLRPGMIGTLNKFDYRTPVKISVENLLQLMMQESCNSSTDLLLRLMGGPSAVMEFLKQSNITDMRVDRYVLEAIAQWDGIQTIPKDHQITLATYKAMELAVPKDLAFEAKEIFKKSLQDTTTPAAMTLLLSKLFKNELLSKAYTELLLKIMRGCKRGQLRLIKFLPKGTAIAHKTGTLTGYASDVGIITLPYDLGHFAISVYIKNSDKNLEHNEQIIAEVGRSIYDYFLLE